MELNNRNNQNSDCFKIEFKNGQRITRVIRETINIGELYNRLFIIVL